MRKGIVAALSSLVGATVGAGIVSKKISEEIQVQKGYADKHLALYLMMNQWVKAKQQNKSISEYLEKSGIKEVAIYGMHYVGETLLNELRESGIIVKYGIDQKVDDKYLDIDVVTPDGPLENVDAVIVTAITFFSEIEEKLSERIECPVLSLEDILYDM